MAYQRQMAYNGEMHRKSASKAGGSENVAGMAAINLAYQQSAYRKA